MALMTGERAHRALNEPAWNAKPDFWLDRTRTCLLLGLGAVSGLPTYLGLLELMAVPLGALSPAHQLAAGIFTTMMIAATIWLLGRFSASGGWPERLFLAAAILALMLVSVVCGFGFFWTALGDADRRFAGQDYLALALALFAPVCMLLVAARSQRAQPAAPSGEPSLFGSILGSGTARLPEFRVEPADIILPMPDDANRDRAGSVALRRAFGAYARYLEPHVQSAKTEPEPKSPAVAQGSLSARLSSVTGSTLPGSSPSLRAATSPTKADGFYDRDAAPSQHEPRTSAGSTDWQNDLANALQSNDRDDKTEPEPSVDMAPGIDSVAISRRFAFAAKPR